MAGGTRAALRESQSRSRFFPKESQLDGNVEGHLEQRFRRLEPQAEDWGCKGERERAGAGGAGRGHAQAAGTWGGCRPAETGAGRSGSSPELGGPGLGAVTSHG